MNKQILKFDLDAKSVKVKKLLNQDFLEVSIDAISTAYPNRNNSHFTKESLEDALETFYNKPVLGSFSVAKDDFRGHEGDLEYDPELDQVYYDYTDESSECPLGMIRQSDKVEVFHNKKDNLDWVRFTCAIWVKYNYKQVKSLLKSSTKKVSVEVEVLDYEYDEDNIMIIKKFNFDGVTVLGNQLETGIADAKMTILDLVDDALFAKKQKVLAFAYSALDKPVETPNEAKPSEDSNKSFDNTTPIANENPDEEIQMDETNQEGGEKDSMLTMNVKRQLLYEALPKDGDYWINDFSDEMVYFDEWDGNIYVSYRAPYTIIENEDGTHTATISMEDKEKVIQTWQTYSENPKENEAQKNFAEKGCEAKEDPDDDSDDDDDEDDDKDDNKEEEACGDKDTEACGDKDTEACGDKDTEACGDKDSETCKCSAEGQEESTSEKNFEVDNKPVDPNSEPAPENTDAQTMGEIVEDGTASIAAPAIQSEGEATGDANAAVEGEISGVEGEIVASENIDPNSPESTAPDTKPEVQVQQPDDSAKSEMAAENQNIVSTVELNGEQLDVNALFEKYNELQGKYDELAANLKVQEAKALAEFGANFINADEVVDEESKTNFIAQVEEKCNAFELTTEEEVTKFAKGLMAMYYYEKSTHKNEAEFSVNITKPTATETASNKPMAKLNEAIDKLNRI